VGFSTRYEGLNVGGGTRFAIWLSRSCKMEGSAMWPVTGIIGGVPIISAALAVDV
jgi:hypothetical protein